MVTFVVLSLLPGFSNPWDFVHGSGKIHVSVLWFVCLVALASWRETRWWRLTRLSLPFPISFLFTKQVICLFFWA